MEISELQKQFIKFRDDRDWKKFHNFKDMALSLSLEAAEVLEHFQWKNSEEIEEYVKTHKEAIAEELVDVLSWVLMMSNDLDIDIAKVAQEKQKKNAHKYPVSKASGSHKKYSDL